MKNIPKISIIIPVHNAEPYLKPCLDCIVRQTFRDFECICVNDASTDESRATIEALVKEDKRFSVVDIPASGAGAARNRGMELAKGKYLLFLDADDLFAPTLLEKFYNRAAETGADIVFCKHQIYETQKDLTRDCMGVPFPEIDPKTESPFRTDPDLPIQAYAPAPWNKFFRAEFVREEGLKFQVIPSANDIGFTTKAKLAARHVATVNEPLVFYRTGQAANITAKVHKDPTCVARALDDVWKFVGERGWTDEVAAKFSAFAYPNFMYTVNLLRDQPEALERYGAFLRSSEAFRCLAPKVSVVVPCYNAGAALVHTVESVLKQTLKAIELIVVDDCSTDDSLAIARDLEKRDARMRVIALEKNSGTYMARKAGTLAAVGRYVTYVDADDELMPKACELLLRTAEENAADVVHGSINILAEESVSSRQVAAMEKMVRPAEKSYSRQEVLGACFVMQRFCGNVCGKLFDRSLMQRALAGLADAHLIMAEDLMQFFAFATGAQKYVPCPQNVYLYHYGRGLTGKTVLTLESYRKQCGQLRVLPVLREFITKQCSDDKDALVAYKNLKTRLYRDSYSRIFNFLTTPSDRRAAFQILLEIADPLKFISWLAAEYFNKRDQFVLPFDRLGAFEPPKQRKIRTIGLLYFHLTQGGIQRVIALLLSVLQRLGYRVVLILEKPLDETCYPIPSSVDVEILQRSSATCGSSSVGERLLQLKAIIERQEIDLMYYHPYSSNLMPWDALVCKFVCQIPFVLHFHNCIGTSLYSAMQTPEFTYLAARLRLCDRVIALSRTDELYLKSQGVAATYLPNPVDARLTEAIGRQEAANFAAKTVLWVGRISWEKHPVDAVLAFAQVHRQMPDARLVMVGGGAADIVQVLQKKIDEEGLQDCVTLAGPQRDTYPYYRDASVLLMTSAFEGFPMTLVEAGAHGLPVVMYELPFLESARDNAGVVQVLQGDIKAAASAVCSVLSDEKSYRSMSDANRRQTRRIAQFDQVAAWKKILDELQRAEPETPRMEKIDPDEVRILLEELQYCYGNGFRTRMAKIAKLEKDQKGIQAALATAQSAATARAGASNVRASEVQMTAMARRVQSLVREVESLKRSEAYRVGMVVTWPMRKIGRLFRHK